MWKFYTCINGIQRSKMLLIELIVVWLTEKDVEEFAKKSSVVSYIIISISVVMVHGQDFENK